MKNIKYFFFLITLASIVLFFWLFLDLILSNTLMAKKDDCIKFEEKYYELKKNCSGKHRFKKAFPSVDIFTDKYGLRTSKNFKHNNDLKNIFILGDSFTFGVGLEYEKSYVGLIESRMKDYNFYNFSVPSYSPSVYPFKLKKMSKLNIMPSKIIMFLDLTDVHDEAARWFIDKDFGKPYLSNKEIFEKNKNEENNFKKRNFKISVQLASLINFNLRSLRSKFRNTFKDKKKESVLMKTFQGEFTYTDLSKLNKQFWKEKTFSTGIKNIKKNINLISKFAKENNSEFYLVLYPWAETLEYGQKSFNWSNFGKNLCVNNICTLIDTTNNFLNYKNSNKNWSNQIYFPSDIHFNDLGAKILADSLIEKLE